MNFSREQLLRQAWSTGNLEYIVRDHQQSLWDLMQAVVNDPDQVDGFVINCARRFGKSTLAFLSLVQKAIKFANTSYLFCAPTKGNATEIVLDVAPVILADCPEDLRPVYRNNRYTFPNGSNIRLGGAYDGGEGLRGRAAHGAVIDEAAFIKQTNQANGLKYIIDSIIRPQLLTTRGFLLIASTPPPILTHEYVEVFNQADLANRAATFTIYDNKSIDEVRRENLKRSYYSNDPTGGSWKREFEAQFVQDERRLIIPNWNSEVHVVQSYDRPEYFQPYQRLVSYDHGTADLSVFLFGWYDHPNATLIIEHSIIIDNFNDKKTTADISSTYNIEKNKLWPNLAVLKEICDAINPQVIIDFNRQFGHHFVPPFKSNREAMVNQLINMVQQNRILVLDTPANKLLIKTLETGVWTSTHTTRDFSRQAGIGHCDALAALIYMVRGLNTYHNPENHRPPVESNQLDFRPPAVTELSILQKALGLNKQPF